VIRAALAALFFFCAAAEARDAVVAKRFMVAAAHPLAVDAGYAVLERGGSALDAAIAVQAMLGLVEPESSGIGGGAFLLYWSAADKTLRTYDGRESAPAAARAERFAGLDFADAAASGLSVGVPGVLRMLEAAHQHHGRLAWRELFGAAISASEQGFAVSPRLHALLEGERFLRQDAAARAVYYDDAGRARTFLTNPQYAATLRLVAAQGADSFYRGAVAADIVRAVRAHRRPGDLTREDLAAYRALERAPVCAPYRVWRICSMGPPSAGGIAVLQILGLMQRVGAERAPAQSAAALHFFAEAAKLAFADRARYGADPDFLPVPVSRLLSNAYLDQRAKLIGERALRSVPVRESEAVGTSHLSIVDAQGNALAMTTTVESSFGSRIMVRGFLLNNELTDFDFSPTGANRVAPGKRPRSSMAPVLVFAPDGSLHMALGSPGGPMIINYVAKTLLATLGWGLELPSAVALPNFGARAAATVIEKGSTYEAFIPALQKRGHAIEMLPLTSGLHGFERIGDGWRGAADPRREGIARGE